MKIIFTFLILALSTPMSATADDYLQSCSKVVDAPEYKPLKDYLSAGKFSEQLCQRLNNKEFLYTNWKNIYYCHLASSMECSEATENQWYPDIDVASTIFDAKGKQFSLLKTNSLSGGVYGEGYYIFSLAPKSVDARGFSITRLSGAGENNGSSSDEGQLCSNMQGSEATEKIGDGFEIINNKSDIPIVRFNQKVTNCSDNISAMQKLEYTLIKGKFRLTQDTRAFEK